MTEIPYLTLIQIAERLKTYRMAALRLVQAGAFPNAFQLDNKRTSPWLIPIADFDAYLQRQKPNGSGSSPESSCSQSS